MRDLVPVHVWLLIVIAIFAFAPLRYVHDHIVHSPQRRDITLPPEDLSWRSSRKLALNLALLAGLVALSIFIFTPTAAEFAKSEALLPTIFTAFGAFTTKLVVSGLLDGRAAPLIRGISTEFERDTQPKRYWASMAWNTLLTAGFLWLIFSPGWERKEDGCYRPATAETAQAKLTACDRLLTDADNDAERANILAQRGLAHDWLGNYVKARSDYSQALALDPRNPYILYNRGRVHGYLGKPENALADFDASLKLRPEHNGQAYVERGLLLAAKGELDKAIADFSRAHEDNPNDPWPLANRGIAYIWKGERALALADIDKAKALDPTNYVVGRAEALIEFKAGKFRSAVGRLSRHLQSHPDDTWARRLRADAYWELGERDKARDDDDEIVRLGDTVGW